MLGRSILTISPFCKSHSHLARGWWENDKGNSRKFQRTDANFLSGKNSCIVLGFFRVPRGTFCSTLSYRPEAYRRNREKIRESQEQHSIAFLAHPQICLNLASSGELCDSRKEKSGKIYKIRHRFPLPRNYQGVFTLSPKVNLGKR